MHREQANVLVHPLVHRGVEPGERRQAGTNLVLLVGGFFQQAFGHHEAHILAGQQYLGKTVLDPAQAVGDVLEPAAVENRLLHASNSHFGTSRHHGLWFSSKDIQAIVKGLTKLLGRNGAVCAKYGPEGDQEICALRWEWEHQVTGMETTVFVIPETEAKNGRERIVPLNAIARSIIDSRRGNNSDFVFGF